MYNCEGYASCLTFVTDQGSQLPFMQKLLLSKRTNSSIDSGGSHKHRYHSLLLV